MLEELPVNSPRNYSIKISLHYEEQHITAVWVYLTVKFEEHWKPVDVEVEFRCKFKERKWMGRLYRDIAQRYIAKRYF